MPESPPPFLLVMDTTDPQSPAHSPEPAAQSPIQALPNDALHKIFSLLPLRTCILCRSVCRSFHLSLLSPPPLPSLPLLALRHPHHHHHHHHATSSPPNLTLTAFDPVHSTYISFPLSFLPFPSLTPITSSNALLYLWADPNPNPQNLTPDLHKNPKSLLVCNPITRSSKLLPQLGSAWSRHGTVLAAPTGAVLVLTELAALYYSPTANPSSWMKYSLNLPSKPRSPVLVGGSIYTLCDVGSPWRSSWKLFCCGVEGLKGGKGWGQVEREEWRDVFDMLKRPRLVRGRGVGELLMVGGLRSGFALDSPCSTVLILRLRLGSMEWNEAGKMPVEMYRGFASSGGGVGGGMANGGGGGGGGGGGNNKVKVFGGEGRVWFSGKRVRGKMTMWEDEEGEEGGRWRWVDGVEGYGEGVYRGFVYDAGLTDIP